jgi:hypothetical protein
MLTIKSATSPKYITVDNSVIELQVMFEEFGDSILPFAAMANDTEEHGRELYARAIAGEFGEIAPCFAPPVSAIDNNQPTTTGSQDL